MEPRISVVINTLNEEKNLPYTLRSVQPWADELVVVDMYSDDQTVEIARQFGAKVYTHPRLEFADPAREFAISRATGGWILILDADELIPHALSQKLLQISQSETVDVVKVPRLNYMFGAPLMHSGCGPSRDKPMRFFRRGCLHTTPAIHNYLHPLPGARILELPYIPDQSIMHFTYIDISQYLDRLNRYTTIEAQQAFASGKNAAISQAVAHTALVFFRQYFKEEGFRDGWRGFYFSALSAFYRLLSYAKLAERQFVGPSEKVIADYRCEAGRLLDEYDQARIALKTRP
jgi:(heptosyl)LPS beta-1,4-glucosyltransferase